MERRGAEEEDMLRNFMKLFSGFNGINTGSSGKICLTTVMNIPVVVSFLLGKSPASVY